MNNYADEINFDALVGPTHFYGGFAYGNIASMKNRHKHSNPKQAALQGLEKMWLVASLGVKQAILPPHERPDINILRSLGFSGSDQKILKDCYGQAPELLRQISTSSSMWAANAATVTPSSDTKDGKVHVTPANLPTLFHRSIEAASNFQILHSIFSNPEHFIVHPPLPFGTHLSDEGAANHTRFCKTHQTPGVHLFTFGRYALKSDEPKTNSFPARQSYEASQAIARNHLIPFERVVFAQQNPLTIDMGVFHNDVISTGNESFYLYHESAFINSPAILEELEKKIGQYCHSKLCKIEISSQELHLKDAVNSYLFNSQILTLPNKDVAIIAPIECQKISPAKKILEKILADEENPISKLLYVNLRQSMQNGGGPACLRLRMVLTTDEMTSIKPSIFLDSHLYQKLKFWIESHYRDKLTPEALHDPKFLLETQYALDELTQILNIGCIYSFQKN